ncbi:hypothetical protein FRC06_010480, partial [Ceratobasidium sp. 370]
MDVQFYNQGFRGAVKQCYDLIPAFQHFRNQTGEDCWAVTLIAQQYLQGKTKLLSLNDNSATSCKAARDLRPNLEEYEDDYTTNAPAYHTGPNTPNPRAAPAHASHPQPPPANPPPDPPRGADHASTPAQPPVASPSHACPTPNACTQDDPQTTSSASHTSGLPLASTKRQNRKADKQTAAEEAWAKAKAQVQAARDNNLPLASSHAKGKQPIHPPPQDKSEDDEEATRQLAKKVKAGPRMRIMSVEPDSEPELALTARSKKGKAGQVAEATAKTPAKRKVDEESAAEYEETQASKPVNKQGKAGQTTQTTKRKAEEELVIEEEPHEEVEEPQTKKSPEPLSAPLPPDTRTSQPTEDMTQISSSDPPQPGSSRMPIAVNSSDPASEL